MMAYMMMSGVNLQSYSNTLYHNEALKSLTRPQSGQLDGCYSHMEKRGSRYLRYALFNATKFVCMWDPTFQAYLTKKRAEGKHYNAAISHAAKKLVRVII